ncbi:hypothetical protein DB42_BC00170 [Neochlamydia sp. EPS4]|uniref:hypothetical protein n=1 Tax=Neochlamydia sp. EPS4 TaxID=1478175 RepID=UPI0005823D82|nr:hypothetical protein [Neochlamydia sp. EPS4]KIC74522.1 hypothetical protein DB42_BC00170 [Neochlamydia sp. EPS4]
MQPDHASKAKQDLTSQLRAFTPVMNDPTGESLPSTSLSEQVIQAKVIMIGETHGEAAEEIGKLVNALASQYLSKKEGKIKLLVEGDVEKRAEYIASLPSAYRDHIQISSWDTDLSKEVLDSFFNKVVSRFHVRVCQAFMNYLSGPSTESRKKIKKIFHHLTFAQISGWMEKESPPSLRPSIEGYLDDLKPHLMDLQSQANQKEETLDFLTSLNLYLRIFHKMVKEIVIQATPQRNMKMVENIQTSLSSADKVIVIAGKSHLFGPDTFSERERLFIKEGIQVVEESLSQQEASYIILKAPSPFDTSAETDDLIKPQSIPPEWLDEPIVPEKGKLKEQEKDKPKPQPSSVSATSSPSLSQVDGDMSWKGKLQASKAKALAISSQDAIRQALKFNIEKLKTVNNREFLALQFKGSFKAIWGEIMKKHSIATEDDVILAELLTITVEKLIELKSS